MTFLSHFCNLQELCTSSHNNLSLKPVYIMQGCQMWNIGALVQRELHL